MADRTRGYAHRVNIAAGVEIVWRALTDSACLEQWCAPDARIRPQSRGWFSASADGVTPLEAHIDVFDPGRRLRLILLPSPALPEAQTALVMDFILEASPAGTILRLLGSGIPGDEAWDAPYLDLRTSWKRAIARLKVFVEKETR
jgi:uncharacterized protein YndB with AHSA1/START domain